MRRKITVIGGSQAAAVTALLLAERDYADFVLLDASQRHVSDVGRAAAAALSGAVVRAGEYADLAGSDIVVVCELAPGLPAELARRAPDAVAVVARSGGTDDCAALLEGTRWPRSRVVGIDEEGPLALAVATRAACDAIVLDRRAPVSCVVFHGGEGGVEGWAPANVRLGAGGVEAFD